MLKLDHLFLIFNRDKDALYKLASSINIWGLVRQAHFQNVFDRSPYLGHGI
jgi:hypothetical protein